MKKTFTLEERIAYARRLRVTWHVCSDAHAVWYWNRGGWRAGIVTERGRVAVSYPGADLCDLEAIERKADRYPRAGGDGLLSFLLYELGGIDCGTERDGRGQIATALERLETVEKQIEAVARALVAYAEANPTAK